MRITTKSFAGLSPRTSPHLLPEAAAQEALNVRLWSGSPEPFRAPALVMALAKVGTKRSIYRFGKGNDSDLQFWFHWLNDTDVARGPIPDDTQERTYFTEEGQPPKATDATMATSGSALPSGFRLLGIPAPAAAASVNVTPAQVEEPAEGEEPATDDDEPTRQQCYLAYTYVSDWEEEGPPSAVSLPFDAMTGDTLNVSGLVTPPGGAYSITRIRLYVSVSDGTAGAAVLRYWQEISVGAGSAAGVLDFTLLGEALPENSLIPPPQNLRGIRAHPSGFMLGFAGQKFYRSETFKPYGWPYFDPLADDIVGLEVLGQAVVICTNGSTYLAQGSDPQAFTPGRLEGHQPCVSKRSIAALQAGVLYASPDGLVLVDPAGAMVVATDSILTRDEWQAFKPESITAVVHDNRYFAFYDTGVARGALIFEFSPAGTIFVQTDVHATAAYADPRRDALFLVLADGQLHKWDAGATALQMRWRSRLWLLERPQNVGAAQVIADAYPVQFTLRASVQTSTGPTVVEFTKTVTSERPFRLPGHWRARSFDWLVTGTTRVSEVTVASSMAEVTGGAGG